MHELDRVALHDYRYYHSTRADLLRRLGRHADARAAYESALELTRSDAERLFLEGRLSELDGSGRSEDDFPRGT